LFYLINIQPSIECSRCIIGSIDMNTQSSLHKLTVQSDYNPRSFASEQHWYNVSNDVDISL